MKIYPRVLQGVYANTRSTGRSGPTAVFIIIEPVDGEGAGRLLVGVLPIRLYWLRRTNMLAAHVWVNIYDTRCRGGVVTYTA